MRAKTNRSAIRRGKKGKGFLHSYRVIHGELNTVTFLFILSLPIATSRGEIIYFRLHYLKLIDSRYKKNSSIHISYIIYCCRCCIYNVKVGLTHLINGKSYLA